MSLWNLSNKTVLIIDDFAQMRSMLLAMLKNYGPKEVVQASNGKEAIDMMSNQRFDIVLCDYNLGDGPDGQQVLEEAKYQKLIPYHTLFVMVTAENTNAMVMGAAEYMPDAYLSKPINKTVLIARLEKLLVKKEALRPLSGALEKLDAKKTIACCDALLEKNAKFKFELLKIKCEQLLRLEKYDEAMTIAKRVLGEREIPWAMMIVGQVHFFKKDYYDAEIQFREVIEKVKSFMPGYDWLAKALDANENYSDAQEVLMDAIKVSPKSILRQRSLGDIADKNNDMEQLEKSRKKVVEIAKTSCLKLPSDYTKLAKVYVDTKAPQKALEVLSQTSKAFRGDDKVLMESTVELALVHKAMGNKDKYKSSVDNALKMASQKKLLLHGETALDLARSCMDLGKAEKAEELISSVVKEFYENEDLMNKINGIYEESGMVDEGKKIIDEAKGECIKLNNKGVGLIKEGEYSEAIKLFQIAVKEMPENITINLNVAKSLLINMEKNGANSKTQSEVYEYLDVVLKNNPGNEKALAMQAKCQGLSK